MKNKLIVISITLLIILSGCNFNLKSNKKESPTVIPFYWRFSPRKYIYKVLYSASQ